MKGPNHPILLSDETEDERLRPQARWYCIFMDDDEDFSRSDVGGAGQSEEEPTPQPSGGEEEEIKEEKTREEKAEEAEKAVEGEEGPIEEQKEETEQIQQSDNDDGVAAAATIDPVEGLQPDEAAAEGNSTKQDSVSEAVVHSNMMG
ncbi:uncharacterized protein LOC142336903 isoform X2 [Convolutriloba macropyga]|uniref:uncharacterized protein LOC142336903 isoform X2 n=1 Tax=Convolutriloba macropyga TaxID=536237 RepID=UPI003F51DD3D